MKSWSASLLGIVLIGLLVSFQTIHQCLHHHDHAQTEQLQDDHCELCKIKSSAFLPSAVIQAPQVCEWVVQSVHGWTSPAAKTSLLDFNSLRGPPIFNLI